MLTRSRRAQFAAARAAAGDNVGSGAPIFARRYDVEKADRLRDPVRRHQTYEQMAISDPYVAEALTVNTLPLIGRASWNVCPMVEPADPKRLTPDEQRAAEVADLVRVNLYGPALTEKYGRLFWSASPWSQRLREILRFLRHGYALFQKQWREESGLIVLRRMVYLEPTSITEWDIGADDEILGVRRNYQRPDGSIANGEYIPAEDLALYVWDLSGARYEGMPLIRPMFPAWLRRESLLRWRMIAAQRSSVGVPYAKWDANGMGARGVTREEIEEFLAGTIGTDLETTYLGVPLPSLELGYMTQEASALKVFDDLATRDAVEGSHAGGTKSQLLGETSSGSRALGDSQQRMQWALAEAIAGIVAEQDVLGVANLKGPVQDLVDRNFADAPVPWVKVSGIDPEEDTREIPVIGEAKKAGLLPDHPSLQREVARRLKLNLPDEAYEVQQQEPPRAASPGRQGAPSATPPGAGKGAPASSRGAAPADAPAKVAASIADRLTMPGWRTSRDQARAAGYGRVPTAFEEETLVLGQIAASMSSGSAQMLGAFRSAWRDMIADAVARGRAGKITRDTLGGFRRSKPKGDRDMTRRVRLTFLSIAAAGEQHATEELRRQEDTAEVKAAAVPPAGVLRKIVQYGIGWTIEILRDALLHEAAVLATLRIDQLWQHLVGEFTTALDRYTRAGLEGEDLWARIDSELMQLSEKPLEAQARESALVAYNEGRDFAAKQAVIGGEADWALRSEVLDSATCEDCARLDGQVAAIGSPEYDRMMPPAECRGGDRCRGVIVILSKRVTDQEAA